MPLRKQKSKTQGKRKEFIIHISNKGLCPEYVMNSCRSIIREQPNTNKQKIWTLHERRYTNKPVNTWKQVQHLMREMQITTKVRSFYKCARITMIKKTDNSKCW